VIQKLNHFASGVCWSTILLENAKKSSFFQKCVKVIVLGVFVTTVVKLQQFVISEPDKVHHRSRAAIQQLSALVTGCSKPCWYSRHIMTSALHHSQQRIFNQPPYFA